MKKPSDVNPITGVFACTTIVVGAIFTYLPWTYETEETTGSLIALTILTVLSTVMMSAMMSLLDGLIHYHLFALPKYKKYLATEADKKSFLTFIRNCRG